MEGMRQAFMRLLEIPGYEEDRDEDMEEDEDVDRVVQDDGLRDELRKKQNYISRVIVNSAQLIAEKIDRNGFEHGYDWCISCLREAGEGYTRLANEVHLAKASKFLSNKVTWNSKRDEMCDRLTLFYPFTNPTGV